MVNISDEDYHRILVIAGWPVVKEEDLEYSKSDILSLFVEPALIQYFTWFPLTTQDTKYVAPGEFSFDFPEEDVFGITDLRFIPQTAVIEPRSSSPFMNAINYRQTSSVKYGTEYDYGMEEARYLERAYDLTKIDSYREVYFHINENERKITGHTNDVGQICITWAKITLDFNKIPLNRKSEMIDLCSGLLGKGLVGIRGQLEGQTNVSLDTSKMSDIAEKNIESVMNKWKARSKITIMRS